MSHVGANKGSLIFLGDSGPELVGKISSGYQGNNETILKSISDAVYKSISESTKDINITINADYFRKHGLVE